LSQVLWIVVRQLKDETGPTCQYGNENTGFRA
jgi:hypothetical protein